MKIDGHIRDFVIIGENIHTTRIVLKGGKLMGSDPEGVECVMFQGPLGEPRFLRVPEKYTRSQDYEEGRIKHVKLAINAAMSEDPRAATDGLDYLRQLVARQVQAGADFLDLNVDEVSLKTPDQKAAMVWLAQQVQSMCDLPLSIDSSHIDIIRAGLEQCLPVKGRPMLNSASLERIDALGLAREFNAVVIITSAGASGMPENTEQRVENASRMVEAALANGLALADLYIDPLVFPISVDIEFGNHLLEAIRQLRQRFGPEIHITGGLSNVSFGLPCRKLINDVFVRLCMEAGADSGIIDPVTTNPNRAWNIDTTTPHYRLAEDLLLGRDRNSKTFLKAYRKGELASV